MIKLILANLWKSHKIYRARYITAEKLGEASSDKNL